MSTPDDLAGWSAQFNFAGRQSGLRVFAAEEEPGVVHLLLVRSAGELTGDLSADHIVCDLSIDQARAVGRCLVDLASWLGDDASAQGG